MRRARQAVEEGHNDSCRPQQQQQHSSYHMKIYSAQWKWVPQDYYSWPLERRAQALSAPSTSHLCKSLLLENHKLRNHNNNNNNNNDIQNYYHDPTNPQFVLVVIQYESTLDVKQLSLAIRSWRPLHHPTLPPRLEMSDFDFRVASSEDNDIWTGYSHGAVTPFGMLQQDRIPILLSAAVVPLRFFWMGGGHVQLKLGMAVSEFLQATQANIANMTVSHNKHDIIVDDD